MRDFIGKGISDEGPNKNVVNILRVLVEDKDSIVYVPLTYRADKPGKGKDPRVHFPPKDSGRPMQVVNILSHQERFNFSLQCLVDVKVEYEVDNKIELVDKKVWRTYGVVRDGELVMPEVLAKLSAASYADLQSAGILYLNDKLIGPEYSYDPSIVYTIKLTDMPIVSPNWARPNALNFHKMLREASREADKLKAIKKILKENNDPTPTISQSNDVYTEQISDYSHQNANKEVECITYTIVENPGYKSPKYEGNAQEDFKATSDNIADYRFKCACIKWAIESAMSHRKSPYSWSEEYQKRAGTSKYYSETLVDIDGVSYRLERCRFSKTV